MLDSSKGQDVCLYEWVSVTDEFFFFIQVVLFLVLTKKMTNL